MRYIMMNYYVVTQNTIYNHKLTYFDQTNNLTAILLNL